MYKDVGYEVKTWAMTIVFLLMILPLLLAIAVVVLFAQFDQLIVGICIGTMILGLGYAVARLGGVFLYAFGELVESNTEMNKNLVEVLRLMQEESGE